MEDPFNLNLLQLPANEGGKVLPRAMRPVPMDEFDVAGFTGEGDAVVVDTEKANKSMDPPPIALRATSTETS